MVDFKKLFEATRDYGVCPICHDEVYLDEWAKHQAKHLYKKEKMK